MRSIVFAIASAVAPLITASFSFAQTNAAREARLLNFDSPGRVPGKYIVQFRSEAELDLVARSGSYKFIAAPDTMPITREQTETLAVALSEKASGTVTHIYSGKIKGFALSGVTGAALGELAKDPRVDFIEPAIRINLVATQGTSSNPAPWHLDRIDQRALPLTNTYSYSATGSGVEVHVLDSGIWLTHNEFGGRAGSYVRDCVVPSGYQPSCRLHYPNDPGQLDCKGHGTQVASLIGGSTYGVAKSVELRGYIIAHSANDGLSCSDAGDSSDLISALDRVEDRAQQINRTIVVNISAILSGVSNAVEDHIRGVINDGAVFVVGAGNDGSNACNYTPARMAEVITVGATTPTDAMRSASNGGSCVDILAPGSDMAAATRGGNSNTTSGLNGTSFATPVVSGIAALYLQSHPEANWEQVRDAVREGASAGFISNLSSGTPNLLAYSLLPAGSGTGEGEPPPPIQQVISIISQWLLLE